MGNNRTRVFKAESEEVVSNNTLKYNGVTTYTTSRYFNQSDDVMQDVVTPGFHKLQKEGAIINNPMSRVKRDTIMGTMSLSYYSDTKMADGVTPYVQYSSIGASSMSSVYPSTLAVPADFTKDIKLQRDLALQKCISRIDSTPFMFLEDLLEFHKTLDFLRPEVKKVYKWHNTFLTEVKKLQLQNVGQHVDAFARVWLVSRFAIRPILISIENILDEYHKGARSRRGVGKTRRVARVPYTYESEYTNTGSSTNGTQSWLQKRVVRRDVQGHIGILYQVTNPIDTFSEINGLRLKDLPETLWALVPLSWMTDRFLNIHNAISGLVNLADPNVKILAAWDKRHDFERIENTITDIVMPPGYTSSYWAMSPRVDQTDSTTRSPLSISAADCLPSLNIFPRQTIPELTDIISVFAVMAKLGR